MTKKTLLYLSFILIHFNIYSQIIDATEIELNYAGSGTPKHLTKGKTKIYFSAIDSYSHGEELWVYDSITGETYMVKELSEGSTSGLEYSKFMTIDDILYFTPNLYNGKGTELWRSDGTETGTYLIKNISGGSNNTISDITNYNGKVVFSADDMIHGQELWISDGTTSGTNLIKDINLGANGSAISDVIVFNEYLYFIANDGISGREIWKSNGTTQGTELLKNINLNSSAINPESKFVIFKNNIYFFANDGVTGFELWKSNGTSNGTQLFKDINPGSYNSTARITGLAANDYFVFQYYNSTTGWELWKSDGTVSGTSLIKDINPNIEDSVSEYYSQNVLFKNKVYFTAYNKTYGGELWVTDGTNGGTKLVKDIFKGNNSSYINGLTATSNYLIFSAMSELKKYKTLWKSDGTDIGTTELKDIDLNEYSNTELSFVEFNNFVFFSGGGDNSLNGRELWKTDGTTANTTLFKDIFHGYAGMTDFNDVAQLGNKLIFTGNNGNGNKPFITDGTVNGSHIINNGSKISFYISSDYRSATYTKAGNYVFFRAANGTNGSEIWKTDGTDAGTSMVKDIKVGSGSSISEYPLFMEFNGIFYFKADDGIHGEELWRSDGTNSGTYMLKDINPGSGYAFDGQSNIYYNSYSIENENCYAILNGYLYFAAYDGTDSSIWRTDGTVSGTTKVIVVPSSGVYDDRRVVINASNDKIFFKTNTNNSSNGNNSLWSSDGTQAGTTLLYQGTTQFKKNIIHNNNLYFSIYGNNGNAIMKSDGTLSGTITLKDNFTNQQTFNSLTSCGNYVYFGVGIQGLSASKELWRTDGTTLGTIKLGDLNSSSEFFYDCKTCHQGNLIFKKNDMNENKIYYANGSSTNADSYVTTNIINSKNFGEIGYYFYSDFYDLNGKLLFAAIKEYSGNELYSSEFDFTLNNKHFENDTKNHIIIYPNPAKNKINFQNDNGEVILKVSVYDLLGNKIFSSDIINNELELSNIDNGIYIINIITDKSKYNKKIIIKK